MFSQLGIFNEEATLATLSKMGDPLERLNSFVKFEAFREELNEIFPRKNKTEKGGRPSWDVVLMFKILILQQLYSMADDNTEYQIADRLTFRRFLGLSLGDKVPDSKTIWWYREVLSKSEKADLLYDKVTKTLEEQGVVTKKGTIVDATFVDTPVQRNTKAENQAIKNGQIPEGWTGDDPKTKHKRSQKDMDARWGKKGGSTCHGLKLHAKVDQESKIITKHDVTNAAVHDIKKFEELIDHTDSVVYADSAYIGAELHQAIKQKYPGIELKVVEKASRNKPLTDQQKASNIEKSRIRIRVEHVFGHMETSMKGIFVRCIGLVRAKCNLFLKCIAYNLTRYAIIAERDGLPALC